MQGNGNLYGTPETTIKYSVTSLDNLIFIQSFNILDAQGQINSEHFMFAQIKFQLLFPPFLLIIQYFGCTQHDGDIQT